MVSDHDQPATESSFPPEKLERIVHGILLAAQRPMKMRLIEHYVEAFGHWDADTFDVRDAVRALIDRGVARLFRSYQVELNVPST